MPILAPRHVRPVVGVMQDADGQGLVDGRCSGVGARVGTQSRTEVLAAEVAGVRSRRKVQRALQALATTLGAFG